MQRRSTLNTLRGIAEKYQARMKELDDEKAGLQRRVDEIQSVMGYVETERDDFVAVPQEGTFKESLTDFLHRTLTTYGPLHRTELLQRALNADIYIGGEDKLNNMTSYLSKNKKLFVSDGQGTWGVIESEQPEETVDHAEGDREVEETVSHLQVVR